MARHIKDMVVRKMIIFTGKALVEKLLFSYTFSNGRMARYGDVIDRNRKLHFPPQSFAFYSAPKKRSKVSSSQKMAKFIRDQILQLRTPDNSPHPDDDTAVDQIYIDADKY